MTSFVFLGGGRLGGVFDYLLLGLSTFKPIHFQEWDGTPKSAFCPIHSSNLKLEGHRSSNLIELQSSLTPRAQNPSLKMLSSHQFACFSPWFQKQAFRRGEKPPLESKLLCMMSSNWKRRTVIIIDQTLPPQGGRGASSSLRNELIF